MTQDQETKLLNDVAEIKRGLFGDEQFEQSGLVHEVSILKKWQSGIQKKVFIVSGGAGVLLWIICQALNGFWVWLTALKDHK